MELPIRPPVKPMLAKATESIPEQGDLLFEPKWDGFRCIIFRCGDEVELGSRNGRPPTRYFPELLEPIRAQFPDRCVVDGEIVIARNGGLDFDGLQQRIHPAKSRINKLAAQTPASFVGFDLLALDDRSLLAAPLRKRRQLLVEHFAGLVAPLHLTPATTDRTVAHDWFVRFEGAGLDGVMAKPLDGAYHPDKRVQLKVKHKRTAECVVAGYRVHKSGDGVGSLLLGLYDGGALHHVGVAASFSAARRRQLATEVAPYERDALHGHPWAAWIEAGMEVRAAGQRIPGGVSRWNTGKDLTFQPLRPELVAEVTYENVLNGRFRHGARLLRWRPDRDPASCTYAQLEKVPPYELTQIFGQDR